MSKSRARQDHWYRVEQVEDEEDDGHVRVETDRFLGAEGGREGGGGGGGPDRGGGGGTGGGGGGGGTYLWRAGGP